MKKSNIIPIQGNSAAEKGVRGDIVHFPGGRSAHTLGRKLGAAGLVTGLSLGAGTAAATQLLSERPSVPGNEIVNLVEDPATVSGPVYQEKIEHGNLTTGVREFARAQGEPSGSEAPDVVANVDSLAGQVSSVPGGDVAPGTSFDVQPVHSIVDPAALKADRNNIIITRIK